MGGGGGGQRDGDLMVLGHRRRRSRLLSAYVIGFFPPRPLRPGIRSRTGPDPFKIRPQGRQRSSDLLIYQPNRIIRNKNNLNFFNRLKKKG